MNPYKLRAILEFIRRDGELRPRDSEREWSVEDVVTYLHLDKLLTTGELSVVRRELAAMAEADVFMDDLRLAVDRQA